MSGIMYIPYCLPKVWQLRADGSVNETRVHTVSPMLHRLGASPCSGWVRATVAACDCDLSPLPPWLPVTARRHMRQRECALRSAHRRDWGPARWPEISSRRTAACAGVGRALCTCTAVRAERVCFKRGARDCDLAGSRLWPFCGAATPPDSVRCWSCGGGGEPLSKRSGREGSSGERGGKRWRVCRLSSCSLFHLPHFRSRLLSRTGERIRPAGRRGDGEGEDGVFGSPGRGREESLDRPRRATRHPENW